MKNIIWSNMNLNIEDWRQDIIENWKDNNQGIPTEEEIYEEMYDTNNMYLDDERFNCEIKTSGRIIAIADLGLWNGRRTGYKLLDHNISECLQILDSCDYAEFYYDAYDLKSTQVHHDGTNYITYREFKPEVTSDQADTFCWKIYNGKVTKKDITKYTRSLKTYVKEIYG